MFRRVMIILLSVLAVVFIGLLLLRLPRNYGDVMNIFRVEPEVKRPTGRDLVAVGEPGSGLSHGTFEVAKRDKTGRLVNYFYAKMRPIAETGRADLLDPDIRFYNSRGEELRITAPRGYIDTEGAVVVDFDNIKKAALSGGVTLRQDRGTPDDQSDDLVVLMEHCDYDQRTALVSTDDPVTVRSRQLEVDAKRLRLYLVPGASEVKELQFLEDVHIVLYETGGKFKFNLLSGGSSPAGQAPMLESRRAGTRLDGQVAPAASSASSQAPATTDAGTSSYRFYLKGDVRIVQGQRKLLGSEVTFYTRLKGSMKQMAAGGAATPGAAEGRRSAAGPPAPPQPAEGDAAEVVPVNMTCRGPFIFTPVAPPEAPPDMRLAAVGEPVVLEDEGLKAAGNSLDYDAASGLGLLKARQNVEVELLKQQTRIVARQTRFQRLQGGASLVRFDGPGNLAATGAKGALNLGGLDQTGTDSREPFVASWQKWMEAESFSPPPPPEAAQGAQPPPGGNPSLSRAEFDGQAVLRQGEQSLSGDHVQALLYPPGAGGKAAVRKLTADGRVAVVQPKAGAAGNPVGDLTCGHLAMDFGRGADDRSRPTHLAAREGVVAVGPDQQIETAELDVTFQPDEKDPARDRVVALMANGKVRARQKGINVVADYLERDEARQKMYVRAGAPNWAVVAQGPQQISAREIEATQIDGPAARVDVAGPGTLNLMTDRGLEGQKLKQAQPLHIAWSRKMSFDRGKNEAHFSGDVKTATPGATVDCADLWVFFSEAPPAAKSTAKPADDAGNKLFGNLSVARLTALDGVVARVVETPADAAKNLTASTLWCNRLEYKADEQSATVDGPGRMDVYEVGRLPADVPPHKRQPVSTTVVSWKKAMKFDRARRQAWFGEDVVVEVTGRAIDRLDPNGTRIQTGGRGLLNCQVLRLYFDEAAGAADELGRAGLTLREAIALSGPEPPLVAKRTDVLFRRDGEVFGSGQRLTYDAAKRLVTLSGNPARIKLPDQAEVPADVMEYWRDSGEIRVLRYHTIIIKP